MSKPLADALIHTLTSPNEADRNGEVANVVDGLFAVARAIRYAADCLGTGNASTQMGALEALAAEVMTGARSIASSLDGIAEMMPHAEDK